MKVLKKVAALTGLVGYAFVGTACNDASLAGAPIGTDAPVAVINGQTDYSPLDTAQFDGTASYDPDGGIIDGYAWVMIAKPAGSNASIQALDETGSVVEFFVDFAGDYTIELTVTDEEGQQGSTTFNFSAVPWQAIHVELAWDIDTSDVDLHLVDDTAGGTFYQTPYDCYYGNTNPNWGVAGDPLDDPRLDIDDVDGYGPENINLDKPINGHRYHVYVHYFSDDGMGATNATLRIYLNGTLQYEGIKLLSATDKVWNVATVDWPGGAITEVGTIFDNP